ncbi:hypothetical protein CC78DRAFT_573731 [Lojkania enalia]|uniref:Uncharacterized protein n=1 Tax=Lojkania enalia TaxID=147567 RepID=A0A9P4TRK1_9PLEO|nr:hypothetical protein CC78DRAFT_573731 [Didymosphaeria enalia]
MRVKSTRPQRSPHLPNELVEMIIVEIHSATPAGKYKAIATILAFPGFDLFHQVVEPFLYRHIYGGPKGGNVKLFRTLLLVPLLEQYTKILEAKRQPLTDRKLVRVGSGEILSKLEASKTKQDYAWYEVRFYEIAFHLPDLGYLDVSEARQQSKDRPWLDLMRNMVGNGPIVFANVKRLDIGINGMLVAKPYPVFGLLSLKTSISSAVTSTIYLRTWSTKEQGLGANAFRTVISHFRKPITGPTFRRFEMWDEKATDRDKWGAFRYKRSIQEIMANWEMEETMVDMNIICSLWQSSQSFVLLPASL